MKGPIEWMARNRVASNILMFMIVVGGIMVGPKIPQEVFPDVELEYFQAMVAYPGAGPSEVAESLCVPMEQAVYNLEGIEKITCQANEGLATLIIQGNNAEEADAQLQEIRNAIEAINEFPEGAERPIVSKFVIMRQIMVLMLSGDMPDKDLYDLARNLQEELGTLPEVSKVSVDGAKRTEWVIEIKPEVLAHHGLTLEQVAATLRMASLDLPAGSVKTETGSVLLRSKAKRNSPKEFESIVIKTKKTGQTLRLGEIAKIEERVEESDDFFRFDGQRAARIQIFQKDEYTPGDVSKAVKKYLEEKHLEFPDHVRLEVWSDSSEVFEDRFRLLLENGFYGLILVFLILALFLEIHLAFWVMLGIPISFLGSLVLLPMSDISINMMSLFAFILVLGIVVDDAIVIGENIYQNLEKGMGRVEAAVEGTKEMGGAVLLAMLTTVAAFAPLMFVEGMMGRFMFAIPFIVSAVLTVSLIESVFILPAHLSGKPFPLPLRLQRQLEQYQVRVDQAFKSFTKGFFTRALQWCLLNRYATVSIGVATLMVSIALVINGAVAVNFFPRIEGDSATLTIELPAGYPKEKSMAILQEMEQAGVATLARMDKEAGAQRSSLEHVYTKFSSQSGFGTSAGAEIRINLTDDEDRAVGSMEFGREWRKAIAQTPEVTSMALQARGMHFGADIGIAIANPDHALLEKAVERTKEYLAGFNGVVDIESSEKPGKKEMQFRLTNQARSLGITPQSFAMALRASFYGIEVQRILQDKEEIRVQLRYPKEDREDLTNLENLRIRSPQGGEITLAEAAELVEQVEPLAITRENRQRIISVTATIESGVENPEAITSQVRNEWVEELKREFPGTSVTLQGAQEERMKSMGTLGTSFIFALFFIYALLAVFFRSYNQPILVMLAIPFGIAGAIYGHFLLGHSLTFLSLFGIVGLSGVVVNDSLILIDTVNQHHLLQKDRFAAMIDAAQTRLRPIVLTSVTTFGGLMPMLLETSRQAQFMIPMAISLGMGIMFATVITLLLVPSFYLIEKDFQDWREQVGITPFFRQKLAGLKLWLKARFSKQS